MSDAALEAMRQVHAKHDLAHTIGAWPNACALCEAHRSVAALSSPETTPAGVLPDEMRREIEALPKQHAVVNMDDPREWWIDVVSRAAVLEIVDQRAPAGVLDEAWAAAEKALPEGWWVHALYAWSFDDMAYRAEAASPGRQVDMSHSASTKRHGTKRFVSGASAEGYGPTPAAALHALAAALGRSGSET